MSAGERQNQPDLSEIRRPRRVSLAAKIADKVARVLITLGGIGVIVTVFGVFVYLLLVVIPIFLPGSVSPKFFLSSQALVTPPQGGQLVKPAPDKVAGVNDHVSDGSGGEDSPPPGSPPGQPPLSSGAAEGFLPSRALTEAVPDSLPQVISDEAVRMLVVVGRGWARAICAADGKVLGEHWLVPAEDTICGWRFDPVLRRWYAGTTSGEVIVGRWDFESTFVEPSDLPRHLLQLPLGASSVYEGGVLTHVTPRQYQLLRGKIVEEFRVKMGEVGIILVDGVSRPNADIVVGLSQTGLLYAGQVLRQKNLLTGRVTTRLVSGYVAVDKLEEIGLPRWLLLFGQGDCALLIWPSGQFYRYDLAVPSEPKLVQVGIFTGRELGQITQASFLLGRNTLFLAHRGGMLSGWFLVPDEESQTADRRRLVAGHIFQGGGGSVTALGSAQRSRLFASCYEDGHVEVFYATSERLVVRWFRPSGGLVGSIAFAPRDDHLLLVTSTGLEVAGLNVAHPEVSWRSIWTPVWYEGYSRPAFVWQSTGGTDDFEPKYSLVPLVFGTLKATFYSLLFGLPLALLGAIYTSEFLHPNVRARVKPVVEMMASLPSVVLGFVAAFVVAPLVEKAVPQVLCLFGTLPIALLLGGMLWELLPYRVRANGYLRTVGITGAIGVGAWAAWQIGPIAEKVLFAGDIKHWLSRGEGSGWGGWVLLWLPATSLLIAWVHCRWVAPAVYLRLRTRSPWIANLVRLAQLAAAVVIVCLLAMMAASISEVVFGDPRGNLLGSYVQRNALIVGIIMGFAIIPIIFTLAEDALSAVPQELRAASLGAGATPWQTAFRVVIPAAMSGLFSAAMVGLGRAAGETMIVLMAAGNTPILEWNPFNGFRTLSANIAVELPEAVQGSTHFRMLFLAALCLFVMTSIVNTIAELVRLRFRRQTARL
ncbi:MAG: ABC transporter permease subunit [Thermoguttaceae bacterium]|nr:ABC transporter permease subunit [Thermoguttaceae bacterium]